MKDTADVTQVTINLTPDEADAIVRIIAQAPLPYNISHPLIQKLGAALTTAEAKEHEE